MTSSLLLQGWNRFDASEAGFKELHKVFKMVTEDLKQPAIVIDADDLLKNPGKPPPPLNRPTT